MGERREPKAGDTAEQTTGLDPITGLGRGVAALVIGKSAGERESVARALHRAHHGADGAFLRIQGPQEEQLFRQAIESWLAPPTGGSPRLLDRLQQGSLFLDPAKYSCSTPLVPILRDNKHLRRSIPYLLSFHPVQSGA